MVIIHLKYFQKDDANVLLCKIYDDLQYKLHWAVLYVRGKI